jgi:hypothetical protein
MAIMPRIVGNNSNHARGPLIVDGLILARSLTTLSTLAMQRWFMRAARIRCALIIGHTIVTFEVKMFADCRTTRVDGYGYGCSNGCGARLR